MQRKSRRIWLVPPQMLVQCISNVPWQGGTDITLDVTMLKSQKLTRNDNRKSSFLPLATQTLKAASGPPCRVKTPQCISIPTSGACIGPSRKTVSSRLLGGCHYFLHSPSHSVVVNVRKSPKFARYSLTQLFDNVRRGIRLKF